MPEWVFKEIDEVCFNFLWRGKDKIKRSTLCLDYKQGGLKCLTFCKSTKGDVDQKTCNWRSESEMDKVLQISTETNRRESNFLL